MVRPKLKTEFIDIKIFEVTIDYSNPGLDCDGYWANKDFCDSIVLDFHHNDRKDDWVPVGFRAESGINALPLEHAPAIVTNIFWHDAKCLYARLRWCDNAMGNAALYDSKMMTTLGGIHFTDRTVDASTDQLMAWTEYLVYFGFDESSIITTLARSFDTIGD